MLRLNYDLFYFQCDMKFTEAKKMSFGVRAIASQLYLQIHEERLPVLKFVSPKEFPKTPFKFIPKRLIQNAVYERV